MANLFHPNTLLIPPRYHTIQEFNKGIYDYIIATDESGGRNEEVDSASEEEAKGESDQEEDTECKLIKHL